MSGSSTGPWGIYDGSRVASRGGVVVVAAQYRLDALGWLVTSGVNGSHGNFGLLDQRYAMRWVADNVAAFGGDPTRVTLWGESAGAMSGLVHMASPPSAGLFQRVIMQSNPAGFSYTTPAYMAVYGDVRVWHPARAPVFDARAGVHACCARSRAWRRAPHATAGAR